MASVSASQAWAILARHARDEISPLRLQELCRDNDRVSSLVAVHNVSETALSRRKGDTSGHENRILLVDLSRQRMTLDTINHLLQLAAARNVKGFIQMLAWGQNDPNNPIIPLRKRRQSANGTKSKMRFADAYDDAADLRGTSSRSPSRTSPSMHLALRAPAGCGLEMLTADGQNALVGIHNDWERIQRFSDSIRHGKLRGVSGGVINNVVVVGMGVPVMALRFLYQALLRDKSARQAAMDGAHEGRHRRGGSSGSTRQLRFLSSIDPIAAASALSDLDPGSTIVITIDLRGNDEIGLATRTCKSWLFQSLGAHKRQDLIFSKHLLMVTGNKGLAASHKPECVFLIPEHSRCEAFTTLSTSSLLPLSIIFGWKIVDQILSGAHDLDTHFVETNPRHNLPVLLALTDVWNDAFLGSSGRLVTPFTEAFSAFPAFVAALEAQTCGRTAEQGMGTHLGMADEASCSAMVMDGGLQGIYDRALYQSDSVMPSELVMTMDTQAAANTSHTSGFDGLDEVLANQDALMCSLFAHADTLAFGTEGIASSRNYDMPISRTESMGSVTPGITTTNDTDVAEGNRPSALLICGKCDAFTCGQLLALSEHRAAVKAHLWDIDPFVLSLGSSLRTHRSDRLKEELQKMYSKIATPRNSTDDADDDEGPKDLNMSTSTILGHYANIMRDERIYIVKGK